MTSSYRAVVAAIAADVQAAVAGANAWSWHYSEPIFYPLDGPHCAVWFVQEEMQQDQGPTGSRNFRELYSVRYWEPAVVDEQNLYVDDDSAGALEERYEAILSRFMVAANTHVATGPWKIWLAGGRTLVGGSAEDGFVRGFEFQFTAQRFRVFT